MALGKEIQGLRKLGEAMDYGGMTEKARQCRVGAEGLKAIQDQRGYLIPKKIGPLPGETEY